MLVFLWMLFARKKPSEIVHESAPVVTPNGHVMVTLERVSTGGTRHQAQWKRAGSEGPVSGPDRSAKKRAKKQLYVYPEEAKKSRELDRKRKASPARLTVDTTAHG